MDNKKKTHKRRMWKKITRTSVIIAIISGGLAIIEFFWPKSDTVKNDYTISSDTGTAVGEIVNKGTINNYYESKDEKTQITLSSEELQDLSYAGLYPLSEEAKVIDENNNIYYKKGVILNTEINNQNENMDSIKEIDFVIDNMNTLSNFEIDFIPVDYEDSICIYAINNGNTDIKNYKIELASTFNDNWDEKNDITYESKDSLTLELVGGEVKEIKRYSINELSNIFGGDEGWLHIFLLAQNDSKLINFEKFICNIIYEKDTNSFYSIINQGGDGISDSIVPVFVNSGTSRAEVINRHPEIKSKGITQIQFLILPKQSMRLNYRIEIVFSDESKIVTKDYSANILVPVYDDSDDYYLLRDAIMSSKSKRMIYGKNENIDSSFVYDTKKFYDRLGMDY